MEGVHCIAWREFNFGACLSTITSPCGSYIQSTAPHAGRQ